MKSMLTLRIAGPSSNLLTNLICIQANGTKLLLTTLVVVVVVVVVVVLFSSMEEELLLYSFFSSSTIDNCMVKNVRRVMLARLDI
jgi:ABC-type uncharacterized transport system involved in gliding motility auxiliary subunit